MDSHHDLSSPNALKRQIHADWLVLDPDVLLRAVPLTDGFVDPKDIVALSTTSIPLLEDAFFGWLGAHGRIEGKGIFPNDWEDFLNDLRAARAASASPGFVMRKDRIVWDSWR